MKSFTIVFVATTIVTAASFGFSKTEHVTSVNHVGSSMPAMKQMTFDAKNLPVQSFDAY